MLLLIILSAAIAYSFPMKNLSPGDTLRLDLFTGYSSNAVPVQTKDIGLLFIWDSEKRISIDLFQDYVEVCSQIEANCFAYDINKKHYDEIKEISGSQLENITLLSTDKNVQMEWGIFTLPITIFLDKDNKIVDAVGYAGQYKVRILKFMDLMQGKISKSEYNEYFEPKKIKRSDTTEAQLNFIEKLIESEQRDEAEKRLDDIKKTDLSDSEKLKFAEIYIKLDKPEKVESILKDLAEYNISAKFYMAYAYYNIKKYDEALEILKSIEMIYPEKAKVYFLLGKIYKIKEQYNEAAKYFEMSCDRAIF